MHIYIYLYIYIYIYILLAYIVRIDYILSSYTGRDLNKF